MFGVSGCLVFSNLEYHLPELWVVVPVHYRCSSAGIDVAMPDQRNEKHNVGRAFGVSVRPDFTYSVWRCPTRGDYVGILISMPCKEILKRHLGSEFKVLELFGSLR